MTEKDLTESKAYNPFNGTLGLRHRDISHMLEILSHPQSTKANKINSLRLLTEVLPGRQHEADQLGIFDILKPLLMQAPNGILLNTLVVFNVLINTTDLAKKIVEDIPRIVELIHPELEKPIRYEAALLLRLIAEQAGPELQFTSGTVTSQIVTAVASRNSDPDFLLQAFRLLSRLVNKQNVRVPLLDNTDFLLTLIRSFSNPMLRDTCIILAMNIAMDPSHRAKVILLNAEILGAIRIYLSTSDTTLRHSILSLLSLLAVPKEGKHMIATDPDLPEIINRIYENDPNELCRKAALELRVLVAEHPIGKAIMGGFSQ